MANASPGRKLQLTVPNIDLRMYRRTRTSADSIGKRPTFEYLVRCQWRDDLPVPVSEAQEPDPPHGGYWWDSLPHTYVLRRRWTDIERFHALLVNELAFDRKLGCARVKARVPDLPCKADINKFELGVAATGDCRALTRLAHGEERGTGKANDPWSELERLHTTYVGNRLGPFFEDVNKVLAEVPKHVCHASDALRKFVVSGHSSKHRPPNALAATQSKFVGRIPMRLDPADLIEPAKALLHSEGSILDRCWSDTFVQKVQKPKQQVNAAKRRFPHVPPPPRGNIPTSPQSPVMPISTISTFRDACSPTNHVTSPRSTTQDELRKSRLTSSHYGFFANTSMRSDGFGYSSKDHFWKRMFVKERAELGRRLLLNHGRHACDSFSVDSTERLPCLPPLSSEECSTNWSMGAKTESQTLRGTERRSKSGHGSFSFHTEKLDSKYTHAVVVMRDIGEGLRVNILGDEPNMMPRSLRKDQPLEEKPPASEKQTLDVYKIYREVHRMAANPGSADVGSSDEEDRRVPTPPTAEEKRRSELKQKEDNILRSLQPMKWSAFLEWAERKEDFAPDFRKRSVCAAMNRALVLFRQHHCECDEYSSGVSITQFFRWIWPDTTSEHLATMLTWVCLSEVQKIRQETPRVIDQDQRRRLENLFELMDNGSKGHCTVEDIAGGSEQGIEAKLKNIVDVDTVRSFYGDRPIDFKGFKELMCEDGYRAHEDATRVVLPSSGKLKKQSRDVIGVTIWVLEDPGPAELAQRQYVESIEAEIIRWRRQAIVDFVQIQHLDPETTG